MDRINLIGKKNAGYTITEQGDIAVIGQMESKTLGGTVVMLYVAWTFYISGNGKVSYGYGRYSSDYNYVKECFDKKERGEYSGG